MAAVHIAQGDQALEQRRKAAATRADHRVRNITALIEDINSARMSPYGALAQKAPPPACPATGPTASSSRGNPATPLPAGAC